MLPRTQSTPLVRIDFSDADAWNDLVEQIRRPSGWGFLADVEIVDDIKLAGSEPKELTKLIDRDNRHAICVFADAMTMSHPDHPLLCLDVATMASLRVIPRELWSIENNLSIANMDFDEFVGALDDDGIFRGF